ncbi:MAG: alcohol dehydrogenase [Alicyclobacillus sp. RIFOXYA1_FULL_53_8]|nr:MAG: alcohol dehydrogenase [Alicyclobacillus sp. RIFOXYA1_FULL_53_8]
MKAIQFTQYGGPEVLQLVEVEKPRPTGREVLIEIKAIGVNYADTARREGRYVVPTALPFVVGAEVAGVVVEVGEKVTSVSVGTPVVTLMESGGYAEYALADERGLIPLPQGTDFATAVALPLQGLSAYHILKTTGRLQPGETVLVHAAAGGVGLLAVQLAKLLGAGKVIATASSQDKLELAQSMGADLLVNYTQEGWEQQVMEMTDGKGVDVALEMAGGDIFQRTLDCLAVFGRVVVYGVASGQPSKMYPAGLMAKNQTVSGFFLVNMMRDPALIKSSMEEMLGYLQQGALKLTIGGVFKLEEAAEVHRLMQSRQTKGKLVLVP